MQGMHYLIRPESILLAFLKAFFSQEKLFKQIPNEFRFVDHRQNSLVITMSENFNEENVNAVPALVLQEMGATESIEAIGNNANWQDWIAEKWATQATFYHPFTLHCIGATKDSAKLLQSAASSGIIMFRKAIYELGIDNISSVQMHAPQRLEGQDRSNPSTMYVCALSFQVKAAQQWITTRVPDGDVQPEEEIYIKIAHALDALEYDDTCTPLGDPSEWFSQQVTIENG